LGIAVYRLRDGEIKNDMFLGPAVGNRSALSMHHGEEATEMPAAAGYLLVDSIVMDIKATVCTEA
jgi:hypothetical protein